MALQNIGNQVEGASLVQFPPADHKAVCLFQNTTGEDIFVERFVARWFGASGSAKVKAVIYSDNAGVPDTLLATSDELVGTVSGYNTIPFTTGLLVTAGTYIWIGVISDTTLNANCITSGAIKYNIDSYSDGAAATFGSPTTVVYTYPMWVEGGDGTSRIGRASVDGGSGTYQADREHGEPFVLGGVASVSVTSISTYINTTSGSVKCKAAIFTDSAGTPGTKIAQTVEVTGSTAGTWMTLNFSSPPTIAPGTYWLCFISDTNLSTPTVNGGGNLWADGTDSEATAFTSPSSLSTDVSPNGIDIYASYTEVSSSADGSSSGTSTASATTTVIAASVGSSVGSSTATAATSTVGTSDEELVTWLKSGIAKRVVLMEVSVKVGGTEITRYLSDKGYITETGEVPSLTAYAPVISGGVRFTESLSLDGKASLSVGTVEFNNVNGELDSWQDDIWQGRVVKLYIGDVSWPREDFYKIFDGITAKLDCNQREKITLVLSDKMQRLNTTVTDVKLGGSSANKDKLIPLLFGQCFNISPLLTDLATHEYQIHNGPIDSIIEVRDNGVLVAYTPYLSTGKFTLSQQPVGTITCSARGDKPSAYANDAVTMIKRLVKDFGLASQRFVDADLDLSALAAFQSANTQPLGIYLTEKSNVIEVCNRIAASLGASVAMTRDGLMSIFKIDLPQASAGTTVTQSDITERSLFVSELPDVVAAVKLGYCKNWTVETSLQTGIPANHIEIFGQEWPLTSTQTASGTATDYKLFTDPEMIETLLLTTSVADTECTRRKDLWSVQRKVVSYEGLGQLLLEPLGGPQTIEHPRFGLSAGATGQILSLETDWLNARVNIGVLI